MLMALKMKESTFNECAHFVADVVVPVLRAVSVLFVFSWYLCIFFLK